jgi:hypothetical protein
MVAVRSLGSVRAAIALAVAAAAGCSPGPLSRPTTVRPMNSPVSLNNEAGSGTVEAARRNLQGTWELVSLEWSPSSDGKRVPVEASGTLTYDEFGNLTIDAHTTDPAAPVAAREVTMLAFVGRAAIDPVKGELKLMDLTGNANPDEILLPDHRRKYVIEGDSLTLSSFDAANNINAIATWHRRQ